MSYIPASVRALDVYRSILGDPTSIVFTAPGSVRKDGTVVADTELAAQTVRISQTVDANTVVGVAGVAPKREVTIFGVRDHPTVADTNIKEGYTARINGNNFRITEIILEPGEIRARAEVMG